MWQQKGKGAFLTVVMLCFMYYSPADRQLTGLFLYFADRASSYNYGG
jgi:hypothetical protein